MRDFFDNLIRLIQEAGTQQALAFLTAAGAVLVSLLTAIVAPAVAIYVARRQIRATVVSANRQKWIEQLRDVLSEFLAVHIVAFHTKKLSDPEISTKVFHLQNKIVLMTDPSDDRHLELNRIVEEIVSSGPNDPGIDVWELKQRLVDVARQIFKAEFGRAKRGD
jgi:hypothetical protein